MVYLAKTDQKEHNILTFLRKKKNWESYLVLVIANTEDQPLIGRQIERSKLSSYTNWLVATVDEFKALMDRYQDRKKQFANLFLMELTMTGNKEDSFLCYHNWELLTIDHEPRTAPFDEVFSKAVNYIVDQALYNYNDESKITKQKLDQLFWDLMATGMFHMQPDPQKAMGD